MDLDIARESRKGSVRRMHVSDIPAKERWVNLKSQVEWRRCYSCSHPKAELPQFPEGTLRRIILGQAEPRAIKDRERTARGFAFPNITNPTSHPTHHYYLHFLLTWSVTGAISGVQAGIVGGGCCWVGCGVTYKETRKTPFSGQKEKQISEQTKPGPRLGLHPLHGPFQTV